MSRGMETIRIESRIKKIYKALQELKEIDKDCRIITILNTDHVAVYFPISGLIHEVSEEMRIFQPDEWDRRVADKPKWTKRVPTEEGWYCSSNHWESIIRLVMVFKRGEKLWAKINDQLYTMRDVCKAYPNASWIKIEKPAQPEEGIK